MTGPDPLMGAMGHASAGMEAQSMRLRLASENISNADTPGYRRKLVSFDISGAGTVSPGRVQLDPKEREIVYDPSHPMASADGTVVMSNVDMMIEMADAREASRGYDANLRSFAQAQRLYSGLIDILKQ